MAAVPHFDMKPGERLKALARGSGQCRAPAGQGEGRTRRARCAAVSVRDLSKSFVTRKSGWFGKGHETPVKAVDGVSFDIRRGECLGLVGESGCGKTTVSKILMRALTPDTGAVTFNGGDGPIDVLKAEGDGTAHAAHARSRWCSRIRSRRCRRA